MNEWVAPPYQLGPGARAVPSNVSISGTVTTDEVVPSAVLNGQKAVATAGTRVALVASSTPCEFVTIKGLKGNTGKIYVGNATVAAANGFELSPGDSVTLAISNLNLIYLDAVTNGDAASYLAS